MTDVTTTGPSTADLRDIETFADAMRLAERVFGTVRNVADVLGDGFALVEDKATLVNVPMVILGWSNVQGDNGQYVSLRAVAQYPDASRKVVFNDGGAGIKSQIADLESQGITGGIVIPRGLRASEFWYDARSRKDGGTGRAVTDDKADELRAAHGGQAVKRAAAFYLNTSA